MNAYIFIKYIHYLGIFGIVASLVSEHLLIGDQLSRKEIKRLSIIDAVYGISALLVLAAGLTLWLGVGKPSVLYTKNWIFHLKLGLFVLIGVMSILPTIYFAKNRKGDQQEILTVPKYIVMFVRMELLFLFIIHACCCYGSGCWKFLKSIGQ